MERSWYPSSNLSSSQEINSIPSALTLGLEQSRYLLCSYILSILTASLSYPSPLRNGFLLLQVGSLALAYLARPNPDQNTAVTYMGGLALGTMTARYFDRLYSHVPEKEFHRINFDASKEDATKLSWPAKLFWAFELITVTRGVGWDWRVNGIPKAEPQTRFKFLGVRFVKYVTMYTGLYLVGLFSQEIRTGFNSISNPPLKDLAVSITSNTLFLYVFIMFIYAVSIYSHFGIMTLPLSMLCVGLKVGPRSWQEQESWPPNFGSLKEAYSIRRFWG